MAQPHPDPAATDDDRVTFFPELAHRLAMAFATVMIDQTLGSEADYPYAPFTKEMRRSEPLTPESFAEAMASFREDIGLDTPHRVEMSPASEFFESAAEDARENDDDNMERVYGLLEKLMRGTLTELTRVYVRDESIVEVPFFLFGRLEDGTLVGLRSVAIET